MDISAGLAMVVCDAKSKEPKWLQVYTFAPLRPASYLAEPRAKYDPAEGKLEIDVGLAAGRDLPPCSPKAPVRLAMAIRDANGRALDAGQDAAGLPGQTKALLDPSRPRDVLYAFVRSEGRDTLQVEINVDDYPRAFLYDLSRSDMTWQRNLWRIRITDPPREPVSAIQPREALPVRFGVDSPADSFLSHAGRGPADDTVRLEIFNEQRPETSHAVEFHSDRQVAVELQQADDAGDNESRSRSERLRHGASMPTGWRTWPRASTHNSCATGR